MSELKTMLAKHNDEYGIAQVIVDPAIVNAIETLFDDLLAQWNELTGPSRLTMCKVYKMVEVRDGMEWNGKQLKETVENYINNVRTKAAIGNAKAVAMLAEIEALGF